MSTGAVWEPLSFDDGKVFYFCRAGHLFHIDVIPDTTEPDSSWTAQITTETETIWSLGALGSMELAKRAGVRQARVLLREALKAVRY